MRESCLCMALPSLSPGKHSRSPTVNEKQKSKGAADSADPGKLGLVSRVKRGLHRRKDTSDSQTGPPKSSHKPKWIRRLTGGGNSAAPPPPPPVATASPPIPANAGTDNAAVNEPIEISPPTTPHDEEQPPNPTDEQDVAATSFERTDSEKREKLLEIRPTNKERRASSIDNRRSSRMSTAGTGFDVQDPRSTVESLVPPASPRSPRATVTSIHDPRGTSTSLALPKSSSRPNSSYQPPPQPEEEPPLETKDYPQATLRPADDRIPTSPSEPPISPTTDAQSPDSPAWYYGNEPDYIDAELEWRWILNLSMHFRDRSDREKFFVTYAENPRLRRRVTVSCDYRHAEEGSLEFDLMNLQYQRDKSARIYESIRDSLLDIQFYDTVTNLKLQTDNGRLHVHVTEDVNEIIQFPHASLVAHLKCEKFRESELEFDSHLSGFVYKVRVGGEVYIKKEIPGPDTVDEFLYEVNALHALRFSNNVIKFGGLVVDERGKHVRGLLIAVAEMGSLIDMVFKDRGRLSWRRREKWARQIICGLSEIHEAGFVQGDFTMSNMVVDHHDDVKIIDINRRGCPIGWEPPEIAALIDTQQRIGMFIGVKSDLYQLGMVLWGIVYQVDEPETAAKPLNMDAAPTEIPEYFKEIVMTCLSPDPKDRLSAKELLQKFPDFASRREAPPSPIFVTRRTSADQRSSVSPISSRTNKTSPTSLRTRGKDGNLLFPDSPNGGFMVESPINLAGDTDTAFDGLASKIHAINREAAKQPDTAHSVGTMDFDNLDVPDVPPDSPVNGALSIPTIDDRGESEWNNWTMEESIGENGHVYTLESGGNIDDIVVEPIALAHQRPSHEPIDTTSSQHANGNSSSSPISPLAKEALQRSFSKASDTVSPLTSKPPPFNREDSAASVNSAFMTPSEEFPEERFTQKK